MRNSSLALFTAAVTIVAVACGGNTNSDGLDTPFGSAGSTSVGGASAVGHAGTGGSSVPAAGSVGAGGASAAGSTSAGAPTIAAGSSAGGAPAGGAPTTAGAGGTIAKGGAAGAKSGGAKGGPFGGAASNPFGGSTPNGGNPDTLGGLGGLLGGDPAGGDPIGGLLGGGLAGGAGDLLGGDLIGGLGQGGNFLGGLLGGTGSDFGDDVGTDDTSTDDTSTDDSSAGAAGAPQACNAVDETSCASAGVGYYCDEKQDDEQPVCYAPPPQFVATCGLCDDTSVCASGDDCYGGVSPSRCGRRCCDDTDCSAGSTCNFDDSFDYWGVCVDGTSGGVDCKAPAQSTTKGSCADSGF